MLLADLIATIHNPATALIAVESGFLDAQHEVFQTLERVARLVTGFHRKAAGST
jgi:hypothetical protein